MKPVRFLTPPARACMVAVAAIASLLFLAPVTQAQVMQHVPSDALVVIKINKLKPVSEKIAAFSKKLGLDQAQPGFTDPLAALKQRSGITQGIDESGEAAIVIAEGEMNNEQEPPLMMLLPVSDYQAFLKNFANVKTEDQVSIVQMKGQTDQTFVTQRGKYAVLAAKRGLLESKAAAGITPAGMAAKEMANKDVVAYVNMKAAKSRILPQLKENREKILADFERGFMQGGPQQGGARPGGAQGPGGLGEDAGAEPAEGAAEGAAENQAGPGAAADAKQPDAQKKKKFLPLARAVFNRALDVAEQVITDADAATYGWNFGDTGVQATGLVEFAPNSPSGQRVAQLKGSNESMVQGLPTGKYWFFGGTSGNNTDVAKQLINDFLAPIEKELAALGGDGKAMQDYLAALRQYFGNLQGQSFGWVAPQGAIGQEAVFQIVSVQRGDAPQLMDAAQKMFKSQQQLMQAFAAPGGAQPDVKTNYVPKAKTVDGVTFDMMQTQFVMPAAGQATPQQMQAQQMMTWLYGPNGVNAYIAPLGQDKVVTASGVSDAMLKELVAAAKGGDNPLGSAAPVAATKDQLPKERLAAWYFQIDQFASSVANYAKAFGMPINFQVPQNLSPIGGTVSVEGSAIRMDAYAPTQTLQSVIAAVMQTYMQMQGGQQPGGPGGL